MPEWVFDTVVLIDYFCGRSGARSYFEAILNKEAVGAYSTVSELELWQGLRPGEEARHEALLSLLECIPLNSDIARMAGEMRRQVSLDKLSLPDAAIAATAAYSGRTLVTRNTRDFEQLKPHLTLEFYTQ
ncbi:MAG: PIN domain-containing protein [Chloroflexi bacterium]|nr:PIN domain-containing protein [Chloroflexota bacterium]